MATVTAWNPFGVSLNITATAGTVKRISATQYTVVINASWKTYWSGNQTNYGMTASAGGASANLNTFGTKSSSGSKSFTGTFTTTKNVAATKTITVTFRNFNNDNGDSATKAINLTVNVPAWTSYKVTFDANEGSGAPAAKTKWKDQALSLDGSKPTRTGYTFLGWSTTKTATSATYPANGTIAASVNQTLLLYAVWKADTYSITYNANTTGSVSNMPSTQTKTHGTPLTLSTKVPALNNYTFKGWSESKTATTATFAPGGSYTANKDATLYAVWELAYLAPRITGLVISRCDSDGNLTPDGTYMRVQFRFTCDDAVTGITVAWRSAVNSGSEPIPASGISAQIDAIAGGGTLSASNSYTITLTVTDAGGSTPATRTLNSKGVLIHGLPNYKGIGFGKTAESEDYADFDFKILARKSAEFRNGVLLPNGQALHAANPSGGYRSLALWNASNNIHFAPGSYDANEGNVYYSGNAVTIRSRGAISITSPTAGINNRQYGVNKVLWSGGYYMTADHNVTLSEAISAQPHGVVLVWSQFNNGASVDSNFVYHFIPKQHVTSFAGKGVDVRFSNSAFTQIASKYLYINNTAITGHANNNKTGTVSGITYNNAFWVLRQVIGV